MPVLALRQRGHDPGSISGFFPGFFGSSEEKTGDSCPIFSERLDPDPVNIRQNSKPHFYPCKSYWKKEKYSLTKKRMKINFYN